MPEKPNIVVIVPEQWRGDLAGYAGHPVIRTPCVDALAREGAAFSYAYTTNPICTPSRCSLMSGWYPHTRGHRTQRFLLGPEEPNLLRTLRRAGYATAMIGKNDVLHPDVLGESLDFAGGGGGGGEWRNAENPFSFGDPRFYTFLWGPSSGRPEDHPDQRKNDRALEFMDGVKSGSPFCVWINYGLAHPPYRVDEPWYSMYDPDDIGPLACRENAGKPSFLEILYTSHGLDRLPERVLREIRARYMGMITRTDQIIGHMVESLKERDMWESTAFFVVSDHGNYGGDFGVPAKWWTGMEDALTRVPFLAHVPGQVRHGVLDQLVQHLDLYATCLELAGVEAEWPHASQSLLPLLHGKTESHRQWVLASAGHAFGRENPLDLDRSLFVTLEDRTHLYYPWKRVIADQPTATCRTFMIRDRRWKYVWRSHDIHELYDTELDPLEERNLLAHGGRPAQGSEEKTAYDCLHHRLLAAVLDTVDTIPPIYPDLPYSLNLPS